MARLTLLFLSAASLLAQPVFLRKDISVGDGPAPVIVGDFNGDGRPDLAFRSWACRLPSSLSGPYQRCPTGTVGGVITVLLNGGGANFLPPIDTVIDLEVPFDTNTSWAADVNADGKLDLLGYSLGSAPGVRAVFFLPGRGNGAFLQPREIQPGYAVGTGDFNGDRIPDLLLGRDPVSPPRPEPGQPLPPLPPTPPLEILLGNGEGFFQSSARIDFSPWTHVADFNRDGRSDVATVLDQLETQTTLGIRLAQADGTFRAAVTTVLDSSPLVADFNRDEIPDLVTRAGIWLGNGDGSFRPSRPYPSGEAASQWVGPAIAADFTGDGLMDLAVAHRGEDGRPVNSFSLLAGRGDGNFAAPAQYAAGLAGTLAGDLDGDGRADLVRNGDNTVSVLLFRPDGGPVLRRAVSAASDTAIVAPGSLATLFLPTSAAAESSAAAPWPTRLGGISLEVRDKAGTARLAPLLNVSPSQINFQVPSNTTLGEATLTLIEDRGPAVVGGMQVDAVAPALFLVNRPDPFTEESGVAVPAALAVRVAPDGGQTPLPVFVCPPFPGTRCGPAPIPLPSIGDPIYVTFFGTGFRGPNPVNVVCTINGVRVPVEYAGAQGTPGLDQINVRLTPEVRGQSLFSFGIVTISIDGVPANGAWLRFR